MITRGSVFFMIVTAIMGSAVSASTVASYYLELEYRGTHYSDGWIVHRDKKNDEEWWEKYNHIKADEYHVDLPVYNPSLKPGEKTFFEATFLVPEISYSYVRSFGFDNGGRALSCNLGGIDCASGVTSTSFTSLFWGEYQSLSFMPEVGSVLNFVYNLDYTSSTIPLDLGALIFHNRWAEFSVTNVVKSQIDTFTAIDMAPVPLPASAILLPFGLAALAFARKRRRKASL